MSNPATIFDIELRWRSLSDAETQVATELIEDAWSMILGRRPNLEADMTAGTVTTRNVVRVIASMVLRVLRNPDGKSEEAIDDYSFKRDASAATGALHVTPEELADITPGRSRRSVRLVAYGA